MRIAITGATGTLGRPLVLHLAALGHECIAMTRDVASAAAVGFPASVKIVPIDILPPTDAIIHLAGESIVGYWTARKRRAILESRVEGTRRLVEAIRSAKTRPHTLLSASAIGIYGDRPGEAIEESEPLDPRNRFRAQVCEGWEHAANAADRLGVRVIHLRMANVLAAEAGFLGGLLPIYRHFGAWTFGNPDAVVSWIDLADSVRLIDFALANERWYGPLNVVAPAAVTQREFANAVARRFGHAGEPGVPTWLTRLILGQFSEALTDDQRVVPAKALAAGFQFRTPNLESCLDRLLPREKPAVVGQWSAAR